MLTIDLAKALIAWVRHAYGMISNIMIWKEYFVLHQSLDLILLVISDSTEVIPLEAEGYWKQVFLTKEYQVSKI